MYFKKLIHPEYFQGNHKKTNYFEGWYYKVVSSDERYTLAIIPGISMNKKDPHSFIQLFISLHDNEETKLSSYYFKYEKNDFSYGYQNFFAKIKENQFMLDHVTLDLKNHDVSLSGTLHFGPIKPIHKTLFSPNIMGFFGYFHFMECYHGILSMTHSLSGSLELNNEIISFQNGKGYIEKDWGRSFPKAYVWLQSNHFKDTQTSFMFSYADIPFLGFYFKGLIANLIFNGKEYRFATYNGAKVKEEIINGNHVIYTLKKRRYTLWIEANSSHEISLASPRNGQMIDKIKEGLSGYIHLKLFYKNELIYQDTGKHAGIEVMNKK